jgi:hypothetical protein
MEYPFQLWYMSNSIVAREQLDRHPESYIIKIVHRRRDWKVLLQHSDLRFIFVQILER